MTVYSYLKKIDIFVKELADKKLVHLIRKLKEVI